MAEQHSKKISPVVVTLVVIGSMIISLLLYVGFIALFDYMDNSNMSDALKSWLIIAAFGLVFMGPTIIVAFIIVPILKRAQKR